MLLKRCLACLWFLKHKLLHRESRKWLIYLQNFCQLNAHKHGWCYMFIDNIDLIKQH